MLEKTFPITTSKDVNQFAETIIKSEIPRISEKNSKSSLSDNAISELTNQIKKSVDLNCKSTFSHIS
jgi:hypothetical protein